MRNRNEVCSKLDLHACLFSHDSEPDLHRIDVVISRLRHKARQQGSTCPYERSLAKDWRLFPDRKRDLSRCAGCE